MPRFEDLPLELLPLIVQQLIRPSHFATLCLVNQSFYTFAIPHLYERVFIYPWHKEGKKKVVQLFRTLSECPHLAQHVRRLEIRAFPKALSPSEHETVISLCLTGIRNCINLRACTWTRDGSLTTSILEALQTCPQLEELEINGHHDGHYSPSILVGFQSLRRISLIMPSGSVINILPAWARGTGSTLKHLSVICKTATFVNDSILAVLAPNLSNLEHLYFVNCPKVTEHGLLTVLSAISAGLCGLGLEGVSPVFNMAHFSEQCTRTGALSRLRSITLTVNTQTSKMWENDVIALLAPAPLEHFHISTIGGHVGSSLSPGFCCRIVNVHGPRLKRFSVHRMRMSLATIEDICRRCVQLEQLFVVVDQAEMDALGPALAQAHSLRAVHVNRPMDLGSEEIPVLAREHILQIVKQCGPNLRQFGYNTRVLQIERIVNCKADGNLVTDVRLASYESPEVPEQFLVVRT